MADDVGELERGRQAFADHAWTDAYESLAAAERSNRLGAEDLELLATTAYMLGREEDYLRLLERAYRAHLDTGEGLAALRCAFWIGVTLASGGEMGRAGGWIGRAQRLLEREGATGLSGLSAPTARLRAGGSGDLEAAAATAAEAAAIGERFDDPDLFALAAHEQGHILIRLGRLKEGLELLDESMVAVTAGELPPIVSGIVYCGVILACQDAHELRRAQEWTTALSAGASASPTWWPSPDAVWCIAPRSCSCKAPGWRRSRRRDGQPSAACGQRTTAAAGRPATSRGRSIACSGITGAAEEAYGRRADTGGSRSRAWR